MTNSVLPLIIGFVEQALAGGEDPLSPAISVSLNGSLAKWRDKIQALEIRVNDPGLAHYRQRFEEGVTKSLSLSLETILTLPEGIPDVCTMPAAPPPLANDRRPPLPPQPHKAQPQRHVYYLRPAYLAVPRTVSDPDRFSTLSVEDCLPVLDLARAHGTKKVVVPISEPGIFMDPRAAEEFQTKFKDLSKAAKERNIRLYLRNGGVTSDLLFQLMKKYDCGMMFNAGIAHLERIDITDFYRWHQDAIEMITLHQVLPGIDKWRDRQSGLFRSHKAFQKVRAEFEATSRPSKPDDRESPLRRLFKAFNQFRDAQKNINFNLGLFQRGDINLVPFLRILKEELEAGKQKFIIFETVPNLKNMEFINRHLIADGLQNKFS